VKNERRQSYENQPYGQAFVKLFEAMYPAGVPYHWLPIGSQEDLTAASLDDVKGFFTNFYGPNNASLSIGGDFNPAEMKKLVEKYFGSIPRGPEVPKPVPLPNTLAESKHLLHEDKVQLPRLYMMWNTTPAYAADDAELALLGYILTVGKNSRLYKSMVYERQIAQDVSASQDGSELSGLFFAITTAKPGVNLTDLRKAILDEVKNVAANGITERELERAKNGLRSGFIFQLQNIGGFGGKTDILNQYNVMLGDPGKLQDDLRRYERVTTDDVRRVAAGYLVDKAHISLSIVPEGKTELQAKP
jgi:zinc protease